MTYKEKFGCEEIKKFCHCAQHANNNDQKVSE